MGNSQWTMDMVLYSTPIIGFFILVMKILLKHWTSVPETFFLVPKCMFSTSYDDLIYLQC